MVVAVVFSIIGSLQLFNEPNILHWLAPGHDPAQLHPQPVRLQPVVLGPGVQLLGHHRRGHGRPDDARGRRVQWFGQEAGWRDRDDDAGPPARQANAAQAGRTARASRSEASRKRHSLILSLLMTVMLLYALLPLFWLVVNSSKTPDGAVQHLRPLVRRAVRPLVQHPPGADLRQRHLPPLAREHAALRRRRRRRGHLPGHARAATAWRSTTSPAGAASSPSCSAPSRCPAPRSPCRPSCSSPTCT